MSTQNRFLVALDSLAAAARQAEQLAADLADDVRQDAERRHGLPACDMSPAILNDPEYGAALDQYDRVTNVRRSAEVLLGDGARLSPREVKR